MPELMAALLLLAFLAALMVPSWMAGRSAGEWKARADVNLEWEIRAHELYVASTTVQHGGSLLAYYRAVVGDITEEKMLARLKDNQEIKERIYRELLEKQPNGEDNGK